MKVEKQQNKIPSRSEDPGFGWYKKNCCELSCSDCGITNRLHAIPLDPLAAIDALIPSTPCDCEFKCTDISGNNIEVVVKVMMYVDQVRSGSFQKEMEEVNMTLPQFLLHFTRCIQRFLVHHFNDIMSSQARRNVYEKMTTDPKLSTTIVIASDYSAILDGHSQDQLNQTIQLHSIQLVILLTHLKDGVLMTKAYSFWTKQGISKLKSDNHFYRECKDRAINYAKEAEIEFDRVIEITDGAPSQFKNRFNIVQLSNLVKKFNLVWAMAVYPPTATFKGEHDGVGNLDKKIIRRAELNETGRYPTTRSFMPLLINQPPMTPRALDDPNRKTHEIDEHIRIFVTDYPEMMDGDNENNNVIVLNKKLQNYDCNICSGIQSSYNAIVFAQENNNSDITAYLRDMFCSCDNCRGATKPIDFSGCRYNINMFSILIIVTL